MDLIGGLRLWNGLRAPIRLAYHGFMAKNMNDLVEKRLAALADPQKKHVFPSFFKSGPGEYGEGDQFIGVSVPEQRSLARELEPLMDEESLQSLLDSPWHECRQVALMAMIRKFESARDSNIRGSLIRLYEANFDRVNNWDLVDGSAPKLTGPWYLERDRSPLYLWARSTHLWTQRIAIMTTFAFIRAGDHWTTLELAELLKDHPHDLMHKATGWMLREIGNRDPGLERDWLRSRYKSLPRTMLRYAIEKFPKEEYRAWLEGRI